LYARSEIYKGDGGWLRRGAGRGVCCVMWWTAPYWFNMASWA